MSKQFSIEKFKAIAELLSLQSRDSLPKTCAHGIKRVAFDNIIDFLKKNSPDLWNGVKDSTITGWISTVQAMSVTVYKDSISKTNPESENLQELLRINNIKGQSTPCMIINLEKSLIKTGKLIAEDSTQKNEKYANERAQAKKKSRTERFSCTKVN